MPLAIRPEPPSFSLAKTKILSPFAMYLPPYIVFCSLNANVSACGLLTSALIANVCFLSLKTATDLSVNFFKQHDWNVNMPRPLRRNISIFVRHIGPIYFAVWAEQMALYLVFPKFIALVDSNSLQWSARLGHDEFHRMNLQHFR